MGALLKEVLLPVAAIAAALLLFGLFVWFAGVSPLQVWVLLFKGAFGDWYSWQNTLQRAAPLMLTALCVAIPARAGLVVIGGEGALVLGVLACIAASLWLRWTPSGFSVRVVGGNLRTAQLVGLPATKLVLLACALGGACAGLAGAVEVAAVHTSANASLIAGYGYAGILVAFIARQQPLAVIPVAILFGGFGAAGSLLQRRLGLPDASVLLLQGIAFVLILASEALRDLDWKALWAKLRQSAKATPTPALPQRRREQVAP
ncbi:MAG: ABC transporter permease subunit [Ramlibacter sp.]